MNNPRAVGLVRAAENILTSHVGKENVPISCVILDQSLGLSWPNHKTLSVDLVARERYA
jgi:hypothetical protein